MSTGLVAAGLPIRLKAEAPPCILEMTCCERKASLSTQQPLTAQAATPAPGTGLWLTRQACHRRRVRHSAPRPALATRTKQTQRFLTPWKRRLHRGSCWVPPPTSPVAVARPGAYPQRVGLGGYLPPKSSRLATVTMDSGLRATAQAQGKDTLHVAALKP